VALKVLPEGMAADPDRVARFEREARALAALNHPNVAQIYELGEAVPDPGPGGFIGDEPRTPVRFLVMELVEGESLSRRLRSGPLPLGEALAVARQVVRGLEAAHARGVIHRDLKAKVLDFGLARFRPDRRPPDDVDVTANQADSGSVVGTAAYMSPEQVRGEECDERCDIWAFGCCVAEMLSGKRTFDGPTVPDIMTRVLSGHADLDLLPSETPSGVRSLLASCLETAARCRSRSGGRDSGGGGAAGVVGAPGGTPSTRGGARVAGRAGARAPRLFGARWRSRVAFGCRA
jgi:serine/threonine-protein kinase